MIKDQRIKDKIDSFKAYSPGIMQNFQRAKVPIRLDINWSRCDLYYKYDNVEYTINHKQDMAFAISNIRYYNQTPKKANMKFSKPLKTLIDNREVQPLMLFINGTFIKWSKITVVYDYTTVYYIIKGIPEIIKANPIVTDVQVLSLPFKVYYSETGSIAVDDIWYPFIFDEGGNFTTNHSAKFTYIGTTDTLLNNLGIYELTQCNHLPLGIPNQTKIYPENIFVFDNKGKFMNVPIEINSNILHINNGIADYYKTLILYKANNIGSLDNINRIVDDSENGIIEALAENLKNSTPLEKWQQNILEMFNPTYTNTGDLYYNKLLEQTQNYNPHFYDEIYKDTNNIISEFYSGSDMISKQNAEGYFVIPRRHVGDNDCYVMVFVNTILYKYTRMIKYQANKVMIPVLGLVDTDSIEIVFFRNIQNKTVEGMIDDNEDKTVLDKDLFNKNLSIFLNNTPEVSEYNYPSYGKQVFETGYYVENNVWTISNSLNTNRSLHTATGTSTNCMVQGGYSNIILLNNTESYNGNIWSIDSSTLNGDRHFHTATGIATNCMVQGGYGTNVLNTTESYNGNVWTTNASTLNGIRYEHSATGTATNCMVQGGKGQISGVLNTTESYNGSVWTVEDAQLNSYRNSHSATGTYTDCMVQGGVSSTMITDTTESYNGSIWTTNSSKLNTVRNAHSATGTSTNCMLQGGNSTNLLNTTESYDGNVWTTNSNNLTVVRMDHSASSNSGSCMIQGGDSSKDRYSILYATESLHNMTKNEIRIRFLSDYSYNKSLTFASKNQFRSNGFISNIEKGVWTIDDSSLNTGRRYHTATTGNTTCMVQGGQDNNGYILNTTESYNGSLWTANNSTLNNSRIRSSATGTSTNCMAQGGQDNDGTTLNTTESYNGSVWTTNSSTLNRSRAYHTATSTSVSIMVQGGIDSSYNAYNITESYDGDVWATNGSILNSIRYHHTATGTSTDCMVQAGWNNGGVLNTTESYNGSIWTTNSSTLNAARYAHSATGTSISCMVQSGEINNDNRLDTTESYNGDIWAIDTSTLNIGRSDHSAIGTATNCMVQGGQDNGIRLNTTESYINITGDFKFNLSDDFRFCNDKNRYVVFVNGRLLPSTSYELNLYDASVPYDIQSIYLRNELYRGDTLDIFYLPINMNLVSKSIVPDNGIINADTGKLYPFIPEMFMIFVNGKKIPMYIKTSTAAKENNLIQYSSNKISIRQDPKSKLNLNVFTVNPVNKELELKAIQNQKFIFDAFISELKKVDTAKLYSMIGIHPLTSISNDEPDINDKTIDRDILYREIIRDYFTADRGVNQASGFSENFTDRDEIYRRFYDIEKNGISLAIDATKEDNLPIDRSYRYEDIPDPKDRPIK